MINFELFVSIIGVVMALGYLPQIVKIFRRKSTSDLSLSTYLLFFMGQSIWLVYGMTIKSWPLIINNGISLIAVTTIISLAVLYAKKETLSFDQ